MCFIVVLGVDLSIVAEMIDIVVGWFVFFQAEDGIRDLVRSRGLGDVYKRQRLVRAPDHDFAEVHAARPSDDEAHDVGDVLGQEAVSYTHLTLPTSDLV